MTQNQFLLIGFVENCFVQLIVWFPSNVSEQDCLMFQTADVVSVDDKKAMLLSNKRLRVVGTVPLIGYRQWHIPGILVSLEAE